MRRRPIRIAGVFALAALAVSGAACGREDKQAACGRLEQTITQVSQSGLAQNTDPNGLAQTYFNNATTMRQEGRESGDSEVETAANDTASALEQLGQQLRSMEVYGRHTGQLPDSSNVLSAGNRVRTACDN